MSAYRIISAEKAKGVPVSLACELLEVSRSGYYEWATRAPRDRELTDAWLTEKIRQIHAENRGVYGARGSTRSCGWRMASTLGVSGSSG